MKEKKIQLFVHRERKNAIMKNIAQDFMNPGIHQNLKM